MPERAAMDLLRDLAADPALRRTPVLLCVPYGFSFDLSGLSGVRTGRVRKPLFELALLTAAAPLLGLRPPDAPPDPAVADSGANFLPVHGDGARVLVVDDNDVGRRLARELLARLGFSVQEAADGREAVEAALAEPFDVIVMDCRMPEIDGYEATRLIREAEAGGPRRTAIVAVTAHALAEERERCLAAGMDDYLTKPFRPNDLAQVVLAWARPAAD
jgi:two-component system sensor histidine kinase/response regulator